MPLARVSATTIRIANDASELVRVSALADRFSAACRLSADVAADLHVALDEVLTNIIKYGYADERMHEINIKLMIEDDMMVAEVEDDGVSFDPLSLPEPDVDAPLRKRQVGGVGIHFVRKLMHEVSYRRVAGHNRLVFKKRLQA